MSQFDRLFDLLEYLAARPDARVGQICSDLGLPRPTCHRLLTALQARGYVEHDPLACVDRLGVAIALLSAQSASLTLIRIVEPVLTSLRDATGESVSFAVLSGRRIVYAATVDGFLLPRMSAQVGEQAPPHATAIGKAILAWHAPRIRASLLGRSTLPRLTPKTMTDVRAFEEDLDRVVARGYAIDDEESVIGAFCVGAPILDMDDRPFGALSISGVSARIAGELSEKYGEMLASTCKEFSVTLRDNMPSQSSYPLIDPVPRWLAPRTAALSVQKAPR